jgi:NADH dehydrogenase
MVATAAIQEGRYLSRIIRRRLSGKTSKEFSCFDKVALAVIGRNRAVAQVAGMRFGGFFTWLIWIFIHIAFLIGFDNKLLVMIQWAGTYFAKKRGARLILGKEP